MESRGWLRLTLAVAFGVMLAVVFCVVLYKTRLVFVPFGAGFIVAYIFDPLLDRLEARGWSRHRAVWTVMGLLVAVLVLALVLLVPRTVREATDVWQNQDLYAHRVQQAYDHSRGSLETWLKQRLPGVNAGAYLDEQLRAAGEWADANKAAIAGWFGDRLVQAMGVVVLILFGTLVAFHFMIIIDPLRAGLQALLAPEASREVDVVVVKVNQMLGAYVRGLVSVSVLMGLGTAVGLTVVGLIFGTRYALLVGMLAAATYAVPWIGQTTVFLTAVFFGYVTADHDPLLATAVSALVMIAMNQLADNVIMPRIVGRQVGLHPLAILFAILAGFQLFGFVGLIIAVPVAASIRILLQRWIPTLPEGETEAKGGLPAFDFVSLGRRAGDSLRALLGAALPRPAPGDLAPPPPAEEHTAQDQPGDK